MDERDDGLTTGENSEQDKPNEDDWQLTDSPYCVPDEECEGCT